MLAARALEATEPEEDVLFGDPGTGPMSFAGDSVRGRVVVNDGTGRPRSVAGAVPATRPTPREAFVIFAATLAPSAPIEVVVELHHALPPFRAARANDEERTLLVEERRVLAATVTAPIAARLRALGATNIVELWLNPTVGAHVPASTVAEINAWPEVMNMTADRREGGAEQGYGGEETRNGMRTNAFVSNGLTGNLGNRSTGGRIRFGVMEPNDEGPPNTNWPNRTHAGFYYPTTTMSRFVYVADCTAGTCVASSSTGQDTHGTRTTKVLAGSIEAGQDPGVTDPIERRRRSGQSSGSDLYYYMTAFTCMSWRAAVAQAIAQGIDVLNISQHLVCTGVVGSPPCWTDCDCGGLNADLELAADSGVLTVVSHGNSSDPGVGICNARYPALRRSGLSVVHLDTDPITTIYDSTPSHTEASRGGMRIRLHDGTFMQRAFAVADLAAPGDYSYLYTTPPFGYDTTTVIRGSSYAAPSIAGAAGMLRQHFWTSGWSPSARALLVNMILMGDSYSFDTGGDRLRWMDARSGAGRTHMHYPSNANLASPWGWGWHTFNIGNSSTVSFSVWDPGPENPLVRQWKVAMTWKETDYAAAADITLEVHNTCYGGGSALVASDYSYDVRKRIELAQPEISGKCLEYRIRTYSNSMPAGQVRTVYVADYFHSGNPADH